MKKEEIRKFKEKIINLKIRDAQDKDLMRELTSLATLINETFTTIRMPYLHSKPFTFQSKAVPKEERE